MSSFVYSSLDSLTPKSTHGRRSHPSSCGFSSSGEKAFGRTGPFTPPSRFSHCRKRVSIFPKAPSPSTPVDFRPFITAFPDSPALRSFHQHRQRFFETNFISLPSHPRHRASIPNTTRTCPSVVFRTHLRACPRSIRYPPSPPISKNWRDSTSPDQTHLASDSAFHKTIAVWCARRSG